MHCSEAGVKLVPTPVWNSPLPIVAYAAADLAGARSSCLGSALRVAGVIRARPRRACMHAHSPTRVSSTFNRTVP